MTVTLDMLKRWLVSDEDEHLEFKTAAQRYDFDRLVRYCAAMANERGGHIVLGVNDQLPRRVIGTAAFSDLNRLKAGLMERIPLRIDVHELIHEGRRVLVVEVPSRHLGTPIAIEGAYLMRRGEDLVPMTPDLLRRIFDEAGPDFTAEYCTGASFADLDEGAIAEFRRRWFMKARKPSLEHRPLHEVLVDAELVVDGHVTNAALLLLGTSQALSRYIPEAEVVFEYRSSESSGPAAQRLDLREGYLLFHDRLWDAINLRNDRQSFQDGLFMRSISTFNEVAVREVLANAFSHRDYRLPGSVFVRQFPSRLEVTSPGGFPTGVTLDNILWAQVPRNRRLAEALAKCDLIERSGQGVNLMFEESIKDGKARPSFDGTDEHRVNVTLSGKVQNPAFLRFLERIGEERIKQFHTRDLLVLDALAREEPLSADLLTHANGMVSEGIIERVGRGRARRFILARRLYEFLNDRGTYTRRRGLDRETQKELLLRHIRENAADGSPLADLMGVLPELSRSQVQYLLKGLFGAGQVHFRGRARLARWYPGQFANGSDRATDGSQE